jgi:signal transduction histidine kinase
MSPGEGIERKEGNDRIRIEIAMSGPLGAVTALINLLNFRILKPFDSNCSLETPPAQPTRPSPKQLLLALWASFERLVDSFVPAACRDNLDSTRRARLIVHFGFQGLLFGSIYAIFYYYIGHTVGAKVVVVCSIIFAAVPWVLRRTASPSIAGHIVVGTMAAGFVELTLVEGGIHSHAIAWLASVPLCALLVLGVRAASIWASLCFLSGTAIAAATFAGYDFAPTYDPRWHTVVDAGGNLGIILFMFTLGLIFELNRAMAFQRMEESLQVVVSSNEELAHLNNEKTEFLGIAAHDLRNPLTAVIGFSDLLENDELPRVSQTAAIISKAGRRMLQLINELLDANAIEQGTYASSVEPHDLRELVSTSISHHQHNSQRKGISIEFKDGLPSVVSVNRQASLQILDNLISNAVKYSPLGSRIAVSVSTTREWAECAVRDQGPGISAEDQQKLFRRHTKLTARPTGGEGSVGLGLSIVKRLAETMGGSVRCESTLGDGSTFILRLRIADHAQIAA